jgi:hypothetical protein
MNQESRSYRACPTVFDAGLSWSFVGSVGLGAGGMAVSLSPVWDGLSYLAAPGLHNGAVLVHADLKQALQVT